MDDREMIDLIKNTVPLKTYFESRNIALKKNGKGYVCLCPLPTHNETKPSCCVDPETNLFYCHGCGTGGDIYRFIELIDNVTFKESRKILTAYAGILPADTSLQKPKTKQNNNNNNPPSPAHLKVLGRVFDFYHTTFCEDNRGKNYLNGRGITENNIFSLFKIGLSNGTLLNVLANDGEINQKLKEIGILNSNGTEHFYGCVTFPIYDLSGNPAGLYGRRINEMKKGNAPDHLYLPGPRRGVFNRQAAKAHKKIILSESIVDCLTPYNTGITNVIPCYGTNGLTSDILTLLKQEKPELVYVCFDGDEPGKKATKITLDKLKAIGIKALPVYLPDEKDINDINDFFILTENPKKGFTALLNQADPKKLPVAKAKESITQTENGFKFFLNEREYEVIGISKSATKLKAIIKGNIKSKKRFELDTVDFYSARSRTAFIKKLCDLFNEDETTIAEDMQQLFELAENHKKQPENQSDPKEEVSEEAKSEALKMLKNPDMFTEIIADIEALGYTGEETNKLLCYIAVISCKMDEPLSIIILSRSAAGKSYLQDTILLMIPETEYEKYTRLTDQALFYKDSKSLKHKVLAIEELDGMAGAIYSIRSIQSSKHLTVAYTAKDSLTGEMTTKKNTVEGPLSVFLTTTQSDIDEETASRYIFISIDESREMTDRIFKKQRKNHTVFGMEQKLSTDNITAKHKAANALLKPYGVVNPYAELLTFTNKSLRARRDHTKYLNLILAIAYIYQYQRKIISIKIGDKVRECVVVQLKDIEMANTIADEVMGRSLDELPQPSRSLLIIIREMVLTCAKKIDVKPEKYHFTRRQIREYSGWSDPQVKTHIKALEELEYIYSLTGKKGKEYVYELLVTGAMKDDKPFMVGLIDIEDLKQKAKKIGISDD